MIVAGCRPPDVPFATRPGKTGGATGGGGGRAGGSEYIAVTETGFVATTWNGFSVPVSDAVTKDVGGI
jgi:hypothetical protein